MKKKDLIVVGELNMDLIFNSINGFPKIGNEIVAEDFTQTLGSSSAIMAANAAALGIKASFVGMVGNDNFGKAVIKELQRRNVGTDFVKKSKKHKTGVTIVMNYKEDRANITYCGAMESLDYTDIPWEEFFEYRHFHLSNFFLQKGIQPDILNIFKKAKKIGLSTSLDLQWDPSERWDFDYQSCLPYVDIFMPNEAELKALTGQTSTELAVEKVVPYANILALKMGNHGSWGITENESIKIPAFVNEAHVDSIGAGDSFNSGFLVEFLRGSQLKDCLINGNLMGAINTAAAGGTAAFDDRVRFEEIKENIINSSLNAAYGN